MNEVDHDLLSALEKGIPITTEPFKELAAQLGMSPQEVVSRLSALKENGTIRRFGASVKPNALGFKANALVAWKVPLENVKEVGSFLSKFREISHCYEREAVSGRWEYNLYIVIHAKNRQDIQRIVKAISIKLAIHECKVLYSTRNLREEVPALASLEHHEKGVAFGNVGGGLL